MGRRSTIWTFPVEHGAKAAAITADASADEGVYGVSWTPDGRLVSMVASRRRRQ
jgi:hypothetical protein